MAKKVVINHDLAKALMNLGVEHLASGGAIASGALGGAATGAGAGAVAGPWGAAIGGIGGALVGGISQAIKPDTPDASLAPIVNPVNPQQLQDASQNVNASLGQEQGLINGLQTQGGIANQSSVYNQLQGVTNGSGPNPAKALLNSETGNNVEQQAALMAGQRGASANAGLLARQIGRQGANIQQNAVGQGAALQAEQSLNALNSQGAIAGQQVGELSGAIGQLGSNSLENQGQVLGASSAYNNALTGGQASVNSANAPLNAASQAATNNAIGGAASGLGTAMTSGLLKKPPGSTTDTSTPYSDSHPLVMPEIGSSAGYTGTTTGMPSYSVYGEPKAAPGYSLYGNSPSPNVLAPVPHLSTGGEIPEHFKKLAEAFHPQFVEGLKGTVPGKAQFSGNSIKNDRVPALLSPGEAILPRSVTQATNAPKKAEEFMRHLQSRGNQQKTAADSTKSVQKALGRGSLGKGSVKARLTRLEKLYAGGKV